jgi:S1-C subfamily serine protease
VGGVVARGVSIACLCVATSAHAQAIPDLRGLDVETRQSLDLACIAARQQGPVPYARCLNQQLEALRDSPGIPDLYRFDNATRQSLALACNGVKAQGPAAYARCLHQQIDGLRTAPPMPDLASLDADSRHSLDLACISAKSQGPAEYARCLQAQLEALRMAPAVPPLAAFDDGTRQSLELVCLMAKSSGPAAYRQCLHQQIEQLRGSPGVPSLAAVSSATRESIELACRSDKAHGPVAYSACLTAQLKSIGVEPQPAVADLRPTPVPVPGPSGAPLGQAEPLKDGPVPPGAIAAWSALRRPPMPPRADGSGSPEVVFRAVEKSVYLLVSAPSLDSLASGLNAKQGSAVAVSDTMALTNCHVLQGNRAHFLVRGQSRFEVSDAFSDILSDRCVVTIRAGRLAPVRGVRPYATLAVGERVYTVGSPSGLENTLAEGIVSGLRRRGTVDLVQSSAAISPGSSGGGLFDGAGNLIGITSFMRRDNPTFNFAIAADAYWR